MPRSFTISSNEILEALTDPLNQIVSSVKNALEQTPPELGADIAERGMMLTGGGALLRDLDRLLADLKARGLFDSTLVVWGGEFGRTPMVQGGNDGRDHHPNAFTMWLAGGGIKRGITLGETDDFGFNATTDRVHVHDLHATILHLLGFDHTELTYRFQGRDFRLTDVEGEVVSKLLA